MPYTHSRIRAQINRDQAGSDFRNWFTGEAPVLYRGNSLQLAIGIFDGGDGAPAPADLSDVNLLKCEFFEIDSATGKPTGAPIVADSVASGSIDTGLTAQQWSDGTAQHATFLFSQGDMQFDLGGAHTKEFWCVISATTASGTEITPGRAKVTLIEDNTPNTDAPTQPGNEVPGGVNYDGNGDYTLNGLEAGVAYQWVEGANDTSIDNGTETLNETGFFTAQGVTATLHGTPGAAVTAIVRKCPFLTICEADARYLDGRMKWRGAHNVAISYDKDNVVSHAGSIWISKQDANLNQTPPTLPTESDSWWQVLVKKGTDGAAGPAGAGAYTTTTADFTQPAVDSTVDVDVVTSAWAAVGQKVFVATGGDYEVTAKPDGTTLRLKNLGYPDNAAPAANIANPAAVTASGQRGPTGAGGAGGTNGKNAYTTTTALFVQPAVDANVDVDVVDSAWATVGQEVFVEVGGYYEVISKPDATTLRLKNLGYPSNIAVGQNVASGGAVSPAGERGAPGVGNGDMILDAVQTVTGAKTFADATLRQRSGADVTKAATIRFQGEQDIDLELPKQAGTLALGIDEETLAFVNPLKVNFAGKRRQKVSITGNLTITGENMAANTFVELRVIGDASERDLAWDQAWKWFGEPPPATMPASKEMIVLLWCHGTTAATVRATWWIEGSVTSHEGIAISGASGGTPTEIHPQCDFGVHSVFITVAGVAYENPYTHDLVLKRKNATAGDVIQVHLSFPADEDPRIRIYDDSTGGTLLLDVTSLAVATPLWAIFTYDGTAWALFVYTWVTDRVVSNEILRGSIAAGATVTIDFDGPAVQEVTLDQDPTFETINRPGPGLSKEVYVIVKPGGVTRNLTFPAWKGLVQFPANLQDTSEARMALLANGPAETAVDATIVVV